MDKVYLPYNGTQPATFSVNGHQLLFAAHDPDLMSEYLEEFGGDTVQVVDADEFDTEEELLSTLQDAVGARVVIAGVGADLEEVVAVLREELPWKQ